MATEESFQGVSLATLILIIEDEAMTAWSLQSELEDMGFTDIEIVANGQKAIATATARRPGLIISDINLGGGLDGVSAAATINASGWIPTLFVTAYAGPDTLARINRDVPGALVLRKPLQSDDLRRSVVDVFKRAN